jgi:putative hydrolase of the HAD superfamily
MSHNPIPQASGDTIRGLLLDFGSVISVSVFERHRQTETLLGLPSGTLQWMGPVNPAADTLWQAMQRDEITEREYWARRADELGRLVGEAGWDMQTLLQRISQVEPNSVVRPEMRRLIEQARGKSIRIGILSNELELFYGKPFLDRLDVLQQVDALVDATHTGILKPDPGAYALAVKAMNLRPDEILFVDDQLRNVVGAARFGLLTQYFDLRDLHGNIAAIRARLGIELEATR